MTAANKDTRSETNDFILEVEGLSLSFAGIKALDDLSFRVRQGELFSIIGPNGAGKTSLFNCISGLYKPTRGSIRFKGRKLTGQKAYQIAAAGVGRMFQNIALFENLTVLDNLLVGRHHLIRYKWPAALFRTPGMLKEEIAHRQVIEEVIDFLDLARYRNLPVSMLPYGVLKRVELGRALATEPELLLLDEPAAGLNQEETEDMAHYIMDIGARLGVTRILIEHDLSFVMDLSEHILALNFGHKIAEGPPDLVRNNKDVNEAYLGMSSSETS